jgi:hypothetical protein
VRESPITDVASVIRSKNAGPFELTLDIMFTEGKHYFHLKKINFFTRELFAGLYRIDVEKILKVVYFDPAFAVKCTMMRPLVSGAPGDSDVYGSQQHAPLLFLRVPVED